MISALCPKNRKAETGDSCTERIRPPRGHTMKTDPLDTTRLEESIWGIAASIDIYNCNPEKIRNADQIRNFVVELCKLIQMKRFGETQVVHFGEDEKVAGFSMVQLIETSLISGHFANLTNTAYLDVFSCKPYDTEDARIFSQEYFQGNRSIINVTKRY
jgi:S-adenosylmethionine/arginine decarboxylase-like enzyme